MATKPKEPATKEGVVKVKAVYSGFSTERLSLWGVDFDYEGDAKDGAYFAELDKDTAAEMVEAGRVKYFIEIKTA